MIRDPWLRTLVIVMCGIATIYFMGMLWQVGQQFADIFMLFFLAWLLAFVLEPVVGALTTQGHVPRLAAIAITYLALLVLISAGVILLVPALTAQVVEVAGNLPSYGEQVARWVKDLETAANEWLAERDSELFVDVTLALNPQDFSRRIEAIGLPLLTNVVQFAASTVTALAATVLVLVLSFYFMLDGGRSGRYLVSALPPSAQHDVRFLVLSVHRVFAGFLRGQLIQALMSALAVGAIMAALRVDYALLATVASAVILLIPLIGPVVALFIPIAIALFTRPEAVPILFVLMLIQQQIVFNVLAPRIMSQQVGLHPLLVFFGVLAGARAAGIWGAIFGVPVVAVLVTMFSFYRLSREERQEVHAQLGLRTDGVEEPLVEERAEATPPSASQPPAERRAETVASR